jgi:hypothetical protein
VFSDRLQERVALLAPDGRWWAEEGEAVDLCVALDLLRPELRTALARRDSADVALGWGLRVRSTRAGPVVSPTVTFAGRFNVVGGQLAVTVDASLPDVDLRWVRQLDGPQRRRLEGWLGLGAEEGEDLTRPTLLDLETLGSRLGLFLGRELGEPLAPLGLSQRMRVPGSGGCRNVLGLFLLDPARYGKGAVADLRELAGWEDRQLAGTALAALVNPAPGRSSAGEARAVTEPFELGEDQLVAVRDAACRPLTVITGPPGTGKSQTAAAILVNAALHGQSALLASRNHRALDAVEERLDALGGPSLLIRLSRPPGQDANGDMIEAMDALLARPAAGGPRDAIKRIVREADELDARRQRLLEEEAETAAQAEQLAQVEAEIADLEAGLGASCIGRLAEVPELPVPQPAQPSRMERWPLVGPWLRRRRLRLLLRQLPSVDWSSLGWPTPTVETVSDLFDRLELARRWQRAHQTRLRIEAWLRSARSVDTRLAELQELTNGIREATRRLLRDLWPV